MRANTCLQYIRNLWRTVSSREVPLKFLVLTPLYSNNYGCMYNRNNAKMTFRSCYGLGKCPLKAHVLKVRSSRQHNGVVMETLGGGTWWEVHRSLGACPWRGDGALVSSSSSSLVWLLMWAVCSHYCHPAHLPGPQSNRPTRSWTENFKTMSQNKPFLFLS
jgi:hypothetical protein